MNWEIKIKNCLYWLYLPSELTDFNASVWAASAFVRSNNNSWNCFDSAESNDRSALKIKWKKKTKN